MHSPELSKAITKSKELSIWVSQNIDGLPMASDQRLRLSAGCLHLAFDHHDAIILLVEHGIYGSAFALLRLIFEAYIRGIWLLHCASETDLDKFEQDKFNRTFGSLIGDLEKHEAYSEGILSLVKQDSWNLLNSFTHSGFHHVRRRNTQNYIEANYPEGEIVAALNFAGAIAIMCTVGFSNIAGNEDLALKALEKSKLFSDATADPAH
jgi:hypothetical protein